MTREPKRLICGLLCGLMMILTMLGTAYFGVEGHIQQRPAAMAVALLIFLFGSAISLPLFNAADSDTERELVEVEARF